MGEATGNVTDNTDANSNSVMEEEKDEEGLLLKYDVVICGTGLVQSIVASALARAGKKVLHCDGDDMYGELDAVWGLDKFQNPMVQESDTTTSPPRAEISLSLKGGTNSLVFHSYKEKTRLGIRKGT